MQVSTKIVYGLQFMLQLCSASKGEFMQVKDISRKESISEKYLEHVVAQLKSGGLIEVRRGSKGGYRLAKKPSEISLYEIISSMEKIEITQPDILDLTSNSTMTKTAVDNFLKDFEEVLLNFLEKRTLEELHENKLELLKYINFQI